MALTAEVLFVNTDLVKRLTSLNGSVEDSIIVPAIILAQDKYLQAYLGTDLLNKLKSDISGGTVTGVYETLLDDYVRKATCWWTLVELIPNLYVRLDNGGLMIRSADNAQPISEQDLHREVERARQNAQFYTERLVSYLIYNSSLYPEYTSNTSPDMQPERISYNQNGMTVSHGVEDVKYTYRKANVLDRGFDC